MNPLFITFFNSWAIYVEKNYTNVTISSLHTEKKSTMQQKNIEIMHGS